MTAKFPIIPALLLAIAACTPGEMELSGAADKAPLSASIKSDMKRRGMSAGDPILIRIFKKDSELEVWKLSASGRYALLRKYEICKWSGDVGPKFKEGDRQAPEGFYKITPALMNPNSDFHLSFNLGFPNAYDRSHGRTGSHLMVHGACSSRGCYAMEDPQIEQIYALARESFAAGNKSFQVQAFPFRMTAENMARAADNEHYDFWKMLKLGSDHFELTKMRPKVDVCGRRYIFNATLDEENTRFDANRACPAYSVHPSLQASVEAKTKRDEEKVKSLLASQSVVSFLKKDKTGDIVQTGQEAAVASQPVSNDPTVANASNITTLLPTANPSRAAKTQDQAPQSGLSGLLKRIGVE